MNVHIYCFDDLDFLTEAVNFLPDGMTVHVCDGRYADFDGQYDLTPGAEEFCQQRPNLRYHAPPDDRLPFGDPRDTAHRRSVHEKSEWVNYEVLPSDEWTLKVDTDDELVQWDVGVSQLQSDVRYRIHVDTQEGRHFYLTRLWQPRFWTMWVNDCLLPRDEVPRETPLSEIASKWHDLRGVRRERIETANIVNYGTERPDDYLGRRADQLEDIGRPGRASQIRRDLLD